MRRLAVAVGGTGGGSFAGGSSSARLDLGRWRTDLNLLQPDREVSFGFGSNAELKGKLEEPLEQVEVRWARRSLTSSSTFFSSDESEMTPSSSELSVP